LIIYIWYALAIDKPSVTISTRQITIVSS